MPDSDSFEALLTSGLLHRMAGDVTFERGLAYVHDDRVRDVALTDGMLTAHVEGTGTYQVRLWKHDGEVAYDCTCPVGDALRFCKHGVAAGLAWLTAAPGEESDDLPAVSGDDVAPMDRLRAFLERLDSVELRKLLMVEAAADADLRERLLLREAAQAADPAAVKRLRAAIDRAADSAGFVDYYEMTAYAGGISRAVEGIAALIPADPAAAAQLAEHAIQRVERLIGHVDESDESLGSVLERLQQLHLEACLAARPDPVPLARRLFKGEMRSEYGSFSGAAEAYADVLGDAGLAEYRRLAQAEWERVPALGPGEGDFDSRIGRYRITGMMESLARASGDLADLVAVKSRDLSRPHDFLQIAELYRAAGDYDAAMDWARRGLEAFPEQPDRGLRLFLADEHHRRGEHDLAMDFVWTVFAARPAFEGYRLVHEHASRCGAWPEWRERTLENVRTHVAELAERQAGQPAWLRDGRSELVRVFLWEEDTEAAWREAQEGGCSGELWLELARAREAAYPADSLRVYREQIDGALRTTGDRAYEAAVKLLPRVRDTMARVAEDFDAYLADLRTTHKRRRKLLEMLDRFERRVAVRA